jgi:hypothetical protein
MLRTCGQGPECIFLDQSPTQLRQVPKPCKYKIGASQRFPTNHYASMRQEWLDESR